jgi:4-hydroxybenzoyl-CoA reductase subunit beta
MTGKQLYHKPATLSEAIELANAQEDDFSFLAGGTDMLVNKYHETSNPSCLIDISGLKELKQSEKREKYFSIGSLVTLDELTRLEAVKQGFAVLIDAARQVASPVIRNSATLGGNILCGNRCTFYNQSEWWRKAAGYCLKCKGDTCLATGGTKNCFSKFSSDMAVALLSLDACVEVLDGKSSYVVKLEEIYTGNGITPLKIKRASLIRSVLLPLGMNYRSVYKKLRPRRSLEFSSLNAAVTINKFNKVKLALGGIDPRPVTGEAIAPFDTAELIRKTVKKARTVDNDVYSREYRKQMAVRFLADSFAALGLAGTL